MKSYIFLFLTLSCAGSGAKLKINSFPEGADVGLTSADGSSRVLGKTPLEVRAEVVPPLSSLRFTRSEYHDQSILVVNPDRANAEVTAKLSPKDSKSAESAERLERLARDLVTAHNFTGLKRYREAETILQSLIREFPGVSVPHDLLGNIAYLERDRSRALLHYERSLKLNPENGESRIMVQRLKENP